MFVVYDGKTFSQKEGVYIGLVVAELLSGVWLSHVDQTTHDELQGSQLCRVFRCVDDFLIVYDKQTEGVAERIRNLFSRHAKRARVYSVHGTTIFRPELEIRAEWCMRGLPTASEKEPAFPWVEPLEIGERFIGNSCLDVPVRESCAHRVIQNLERQACNLWQAGYPTNVIVEVLEKLIKNVKKASVWVMSLPVKNNKRKPKTEKEVRVI